jgi:3-oxoacyl-[acyl-carrier protein] reductase
VSFSFRACSNTLANNYIKIMKNIDKVVIITGSGTGIGRHLALAFGREGAKVTIADIDVDGLKETQSILQSENIIVQAITTNVTNPDDAERLVSKTVQAFGRVDILVNVAGIDGLETFLDATPKVFSQVLDVNIMGTFLCSQAAAKEMVKKKVGRIINYASISGQRAGWGRTAYGTAKAAVIHMTRQMAVELAEHGITVNVISPGPVATPSAQKAHTLGTKEAYQKTIPLQRFGTVEEMSHATLFLASDEATYITGHNLNVDGGFMAMGIKFDDFDE